MLGRILNSLPEYYSLPENIQPTSSGRASLIAKQFWYTEYIANTLIARFMWPTWGPSGADRTDPGGPHVGPMNFVIWVAQNDRATHSLRPCRFTSHKISFKPVLIIIALPKTSTLIAHSIHISTVNVACPRNGCSVEV